MLFLLLISFSDCKVRNTEDQLYSGFKSPPAEARPFVRWWWNGNRIDSAGIKRDLDILHAAGIGGVEINPIAMPEEVRDTLMKPVVWLSREWNNLVAYASREAKEKGMITDLIVGSGWPFGGEFLKKNETIQRVITNKIPFKGGAKIHESEEGLVQKAIAAINRPSQEKVLSNELFFLRLIPEGSSDTAQIIDLLPYFNKEEGVNFAVPGGRYELVYGILQKGHRQVMHGALGASGPVMNHYDPKNYTGVSGPVTENQRRYRYTAESVDQGFILRQYRTRRIKLDRRIRGILLPDLSLSPRTLVSLHFL